MNVSDVIDALTERLGPPAKRESYMGRASASWGKCAYLCRGVSCFSHADGSTRVDVWQPISGIPVRALVIDGADVPGAPPFRSSIVRKFSTVADVEAYDGIVWPAIVPLDVALELAAKAMTEAA